MNTMLSDFIIFTHNTPCPGSIPVAFPNQRYHPCELRCHLGRGPPHFLPGEGVCGSVLMELEPWLSREQSSGLWCLLTSMLSICG